MPECFFWCFLPVRFLFLSVSVVVWLWLAPQRFTCWKFCPIVAILRSHRDSKILLLIGNSVYWVGIMLFPPGATPCFPGKSLKHRLLQKTLSHPLNECLPCSLTNITCTYMLILHMAGFLSGTMLWCCVWELLLGQYQHHVDWTFWLPECWVINVPYHKVHRFRYSSQQH